MSSSSTFWLKNRQAEATQQSAFEAGSSWMLVWCVWTFIAVVQKNSRSWNRFVIPLMILVLEVCVTCLYSVCSVWFAAILCLSSYYECQLPKVCIYMWNGKYRHTRILTSCCKLVLRCTLDHSLHQISAHRFPKQESLILKWPIRWSIALQTPRLQPIAEECAQC